MEPSREKYLSGIMIILQILLSIYIFYLIDYIFPHINVELPDQIFIYSQIAIVWAFLLVKFKMGTVFRMKSLFELLKGYVVMISIGGLILLAETLLARLIFNLEGYPLWNIVFFAVFDIIILILFKIVFYSLITQIRKSGKNIRNIILIADADTEAFITLLQKSKDWGYKIVSIITPDEAFAANSPKAVFIKSNSELKDFLTNNVVDEVFYCLPLTDRRYDVQTVICDVEQKGILLYLVQESFLNRLDKLKNGDFRLDSALDLQTGYARYFSYKIKMMIDLTLSSLIVVLLTLPALVIAALIKLEDGGPVFFRQQRIGLNGRRFVCIKFRTMVVNAEALQADLQTLNEVDGPVFKIKRDPRITRIGRFLRKTSIDELPQFYNVIKGEMSIVGPRPPLLQEVQQYEYYQLRRLSMKPGITCIWQVEGRNIVTFKEWIEMDLRYIDNWSLWLDVKLFFRTIVVVFKGSGS